MKKSFVIVSLLLVLILPVFAPPLTAIIFQESSRLADEVAAWTKQCGDKSFGDQTCMTKRYQISGDLGKFVALINDELAVLRSGNQDTADDESIGRRKIMELEARNALHVIRCLAAPASDTQCAKESAAIEEEKAALQTEYKATHARFDGKWIAIPVQSGELKKR